MNKSIIALIFLLFIFNCSDRTIYSGKVFNKENFNNLNFKTKVDLIKEFGQPSYEDPISKKFFYFSEKRKKSTIFKKNIDYSYVFVFGFDDENKVISNKVYNLKDKKEINLIEDETSNEIVKRGLLEKIFGGIGTQQELPSSK